MSSTSPPMPPRAEGSSIEEMLHEIGKGFKAGRSRVDLDDYFELLDWAQVFRIRMSGTDEWKDDVAFEIDGAKYLLLFLLHSAATKVAGLIGGEIVSPIRARDLLQRLADGQGVIVDYGTDAEVRIRPAELTELCEGIRIKLVRQEATNGWLASIEARLESESVARDQRAERAMDLWAEQNGFRVLPNSRRAFRIRRFFAPSAQASLSEADYKANPDIGYLTTKLLAWRLRAILTNLVFANRPALPHELDARDWLELLQRAEFEYRGRSQSFLESCTASKVTAKWPRLGEARKVSVANGSGEGQLFKFGWAEHIEPMLDNGTIKVFPATHFEDPSIHPALRDNEAARSALLDPRESEVTLIGHDGVRSPVTATGPITATTRLGNYYVWCTTSTFDPRLFDDFGYDACLVIRDADEFIRRLNSAADQQWAGWVGACKLVRYFDPLKCRWKHLSAFHKEFKCAYQREFRFVWDPPTPSAAVGLKPRDLRLGSLRDVASALKI